MQVVVQVSAVARDFWLNRRLWADASRLVAAARLTRGRARLLRAVGHGVGMTDSLALEDVPAGGPLRLPGECPAARRL